MMRLIWRENMKKKFILILLAVVLLGGVYWSSKKNETFVVHVHVPDSWETAGLWAWSREKGDLFYSWPGAFMEYEGLGWYSYELPEWVDHVVINGQNGQVQTGDLVVIPYEVWIEIQEDGSAAAYYSKPVQTGSYNEGMNTSTNSAYLYDQTFDSMKQSDFPVVSTALDILSVLVVSPEQTIKYEYGYNHNGVQEMAVVYYYDVGDMSDDQIIERIARLREFYQEESADFNCAAVEDGLYDEYILLTVHFWGLDNPSNIRQVMDFMGMDTDPAQTYNRIDLPDVLELEAMGYYVKCS